MKHTILQIFLIGILVWICLNNFFYSFLLSSLILLIISIICFNFCVYNSYYRHFCFSFSLGIFLWIFMSSLSLFGMDYRKEFMWDLSFWYKYQLQGKIIDIYKQDVFFWEYIVEIYKADNKVFPQDIRTIVKIPSNFTIQVGDIIWYDSSIQPIENFNYFSYQEYMLSQDIYFRSYAPTITRLESYSFVWIESYFYDIRQYFLSIIKELYPETESIFLWWILLWARESISEDIKEDFNNSGLTHFIAVSGFNITILIIFFGLLFQFFPPILRVFFMVTCILLFTYLVGFSQPVIRAAIMWSIWYIALMSGRSISAFTLLLITAVIMSINSPLSLTYDISFQLSFLAVLWIIFTQDLYKKIFSFLPQTLSIQEAVILTFSAMTFTLPLMMFQFWQISLLAPLSNILVSWTIPIAMFLWFFSLIGYMISPLIWYSISFFAWIFLKFDMMIVYIFWNIEWALWKIDIWIYSQYFQVIAFIFLFLLVGILRIVFIRKF